MSARACQCSALLYDPLLLRALLRTDEQSARAHAGFNGERRTLFLFLKSIAASCVDARLALYNRDVHSVRCLAALRWTCAASGTTVHRIYDQCTACDETRVNKDLFIECAAFFVQSLGLFVCDDGGLLR